MHTYMHTHTHTHTGWLSHRKRQRPHTYRRIQAKKHTVGSGWGLKIVPPTTHINTARVDWWRFAVGMGDGRARNGQTWFGPFYFGEIGFLYACIYACISYMGIYRLLTKIWFVYMYAWMNTYMRVCILLATQRTCASPIICTCIYIHT
jgi:hypothetical protein